MTTVSVGARLHIGFRNLTRTGDLVFGGIGAAIDRPRVVVRARPAASVQCDHNRAHTFAERACALLAVDGARVTVERSLPPHRGYGSGTQLALAVYAAIADATDATPTIHQHAPALGRGRRSGVGIATFEAGGFVVDGGHPTDAPHLDDPGAAWEVPQCAIRRELPGDWRFMLVDPDVPPGRHRTEEAQSIRAVLDTADADLAADVEDALEQAVIPGLRDGDIERFGTGIARIDHYNGTWFSREQADRYRAEIGTVVRSLRASDVVHGVGQSSWGPLVYGVTHKNDAAAARMAGDRALTAAGQDGTVRLARPRNTGYDIDNNNANNSTMRRFDGGVISE